MEMNTRLQVEHPVTEAVTGLDLVEWQLRTAAGEPLPLQQEEVRFSGHAIEARLCAEDPEKDFLPQAGTLALWQAAEGVRTDHALESGMPIPPYYDSLIAKVIAHGRTRDEARERLARALDDTVCLGLPTNKAFLAAVLRNEAFARGEATTGFLAGRSFPAPQPEADDYTLAAALLARAAGYGEWTGWSNNPEHALRARFGERDVAVRYRDLPRAAEVKLQHVVEGDTVHFAHDGASHSFRNILHEPPAKRGANVGDGRLSAPMNGRVVAVHAKPGEQVAAGTALVVLEAMKMEHGLSLPAAVKVKAVHVSAGIQVAPGHLLVEFEPA
jgi:geranyl-CoA carboxylase alpha subunit